MPVPLRDDGHAGPTQHMVLFVHGFTSNASCWRTLLSQLRSDERFAEEYQFETFDYVTAIVQMKPLQRLPTLEELGIELGQFLDRTLVDDTGQDKFIDTTLVGHSMGGLVIQSTSRESCKRDEAGGWRGSAKSFSLRHLTLDPSC